MREGDKVPCNLEDCSCTMATTVIKKDVSTSPSRQQPEQFSDTFRKNRVRCRILTTAKLTDKWHLAQTSCCRARQPLAAGHKLLGYLLHTSRKQGACFFRLQSVTPAAYRKMHVGFLSDLCSCVCSANRWLEVLSFERGDPHLVSACHRDVQEPLQSESVGLPSRYQLSPNLAAVVFSQI